jgi:oxygen-independent coproporphyrinogen-3 oxidase
MAEKVVGAPTGVATEWLRRFDVPGPRYTSYPTADRFVEAFGAADLVQALSARASGGASVGNNSALSLYVHIPFCESVCYYCACSKVITKHHSQSGPYLQALERETALVARQLAGQQAVSQLHLGGGSPTFLSDAELQQLMTMLRASFRLLPDAEISIEVDPRTVDEARLAHLACLGFNRLSFGVQDFDADVQQAVHRVQSLPMVQRLLLASRALGFQSTNVDLIYGLPLQTPQSMARTVQQVAALRPDRIALFHYAHLPQRFKPQRRIDVRALPSPDDKLQMLASAIDGFLQQGYSHIGMDHFALPGDSLAIAKRQGRLHRNFQGYSTQPDCDVIGLGVSAISRVGATYSQNAKSLPDYFDLLRQGQLPVVRGLALTRDDLLRRAVIMALMCQGRVEFESIELAHLVDMRSCFSSEFSALQVLADSGLVTLDARAIEVTPVGWYVVRALAMVFDRHLRADAARERFSRVI